MLKSRVKSAVNFINDFEHFVARYTRQEGCTGVICGHIHVPAIRTIDGIAYYNCGDWVEHCTALVEHLDGTMELVAHDGIGGRAAGQPVDRTLDTDQSPLFPDLAALVTPAVVSGLAGRL
jgi:hypothetical protein